MISYKIKAQVYSVRELFYDRYVSGLGKGAQFEKVSRGWFIGLTGSQELLHVGDNKPPVEIGDYADITITLGSKQ